MLLRRATVVACSTLALLTAAGPAASTATAAVNLCPDGGPSGACDRASFDLRVIPQNWRTFSVHATASDDSVIGIKLGKVAGGSSVKLRLIGCASNSPIISRTKVVQQNTSVTLHMDGTAGSCFRLSAHGNGSATNMKGVLVFPAG